MKSLTALLTSHIIDSFTPFSWSGFQERCNDEVINATDTGEDRMVRGH
jgi:hypothetical protein